MSLARAFAWPLLWFCFGVFFSLDYLLTGVSNGGLCPSVGWLVGWLVVDSRTFFPIDAWGFLVCIIGTNVFYKTNPRETSVPPRFFTSSLFSIMLRGSGGGGGGITMCCVPTN